MHPGLRPTGARQRRVEMRHGDERLARAEHDLAPVAADDRHGCGEIDDQHALGMRQFAPCGEAGGTLGIIAIAADQPGEQRRRRDRGHAPRIHAIVMEVNRAQARRRNRHGCKVYHPAARRDIPRNHRAPTQ